MLRSNSTPASAAAEKSGLWSGLLDDIGRTLGTQGASPRDVLHFITRFGCYTFPRQVTDLQTAKITTDYLAWLDENGTPLSSFPADLRESEDVDPSLTWSEGGRSVSTMLLFHLCIAMRLQRHARAPKRILEIGGGYGGLARIAKILWPDCEYTILDLRDSLKFSSLFLESNFPSARFRRDPVTLADDGAAPRFDFELVASDSVHDLYGRTFDVALNTCSFGEMQQSAVDFYREFVETKIETRFLYSINRYGHRAYGDLMYQAPRDAGTDTADLAFFAGPQWDVRVWDCWNETGFAEIEIAAAPYLEILLERVNAGEPHLRDKAARLLHAAQNLDPHSGTWHYCLFNAVRYYPTVSALAKYVGYLTENNWPEAPFFRGLQGIARPDTDRSEVAPRPDDPILLQNLAFTRLSRVRDRRLHERIAALTVEVANLRRESIKLTLQQDEQKRAVAHATRRQRARMPVLVLLVRQLFIWLHVASRCFFYALRPRLAVNRLRYALIGSLTWRYAGERLLNYLTHPRMLMMRLGKLHVGNRTLGHLARGVAVYATHPQMIAGRVRRFLETRPGSYLDALSDATAADDPKSLQALANGLFMTGLMLFNDDIQSTAKAVALLEAAAALNDTPVAAIHLAAVLIKTNQNERATDVYKAALHRWPQSRELWHHAGVHFLRHGTRADVESFYDSILKHDPRHPLAGFIVRAYRTFPDRVASIVASADSSDSRPRIIIGCAVWGKTFSRMYVDYLLASLLAEGNIPAFGAHYDITAVVFTTEADEAFIRDSAQYREAVAHCRFHFVHLDPEDIAIATHPDPEISATAKFALMSGAHYAVIEAGRRLDAVALIFGADNVVNDAFLTAMDRILTSHPAAPAITLPGYRLPAGEVIPALKARYRRSDGAIAISATELGDFLRRFMPEPFFVDAAQFTRFPLFLCWPIGDRGMVVHANHHMPSVIRCSALKGPVDISIDPVDGRFLTRHVDDLDAIYMPSSSEMGLFDIAENPLVDARPGSAFDENDVAAWLWCYDDALRGRYFRHALFYGVDEHAPEPAATEQRAREAVDRILHRLDAQRASVLLGGGDATNTNAA